MLVGFRYPVGLALGSLALTALLVLFLPKLVGPGDPAVQRDRKVERILADSAPLVAADLAGFQERRRREGSGYARDTEALVGDWLTQFGAKHRRQMREWTQYWRFQDRGLPRSYLLGR